MSGAPRVFMDVSYTRTQDGNVGITRTVRRLAQELRATPVIFHSDGFRTAPAAAGSDAARASDRTGLATRLFRSASQGLGRRVAAALPVGLLHPAWSFVSMRMFDAMSRREPRVSFRPGDWLVLADQSWNYDAWRAVARARREGAFAVLVVYDLIPLRQPQYCAPLFTRAFGAWLRKMLACCDAAVCISEATRDDLLRWCAEQGLPLPRAAHFRLGGDLAPLRGGDVRAEAASFMAPLRGFFAAVGTIEPRKNHALLLEAFESLWRQGVRAPLLVAGRVHDECRAVAERMRTHPEQGRLLLNLFDAGDAEVALAYARARALVFPTLAEGFGLPLVEARSRGLPVIASDLPVLRELADEGVDLFAPGDAAALEARLRAHWVLDSPVTVPSMAPFTWADSAKALRTAIAALHACSS
jgi:alpha-1,2-rhamnosyltransferase